MTATEGHIKQPLHAYLYSKYPRLLGQALAEHFNLNPLTDIELNKILFGVLCSHRSIQGYVLTICEYLIRGLAGLPEEMIDPRNASTQKRALLLWKKIEPLADSRVRLADIVYHESEL